MSHQMGVEGNITTCPHQDARCLTQGFGWVFRYGPVVLITCERESCDPSSINDDAGWIKAIRFVQS